MQRTMALIRILHSAPVMAGALLSVMPVSIIAQCAAGQGQSFYLQVPITNRTAYSAQVNTAFDHSMTADYGSGKDNVVVRFTGERGDLNCNNAPCSDYGATISGTALYG